MAPFATLEDLKAGIEFDLDTGLERLAEETLDEVSELIRTYGQPWEATNAPGYVKKLTLKATKRFLRNPDSYVQSRAGDETLMWSDLRENAGGAYLTRQEIDAVRRLAGHRSLMSVPVRAWGTTRPTQTYVPVEGGGKPFPMGARSPADEAPVDPYWNSAVGFGVPTDAIPTAPL